MQKSLENSKRESRHIFCYCSCRNTSPELFMKCAHFTKVPQGYYLKLVVAIIQFTAYIVIVLPKLVLTHKSEVMSMLPLMYLACTCTYVSGGFNKLEVFSEDIPRAVLLWKKVTLRYKWYHFWFHVSCLVHGLHGVWCSFQGWDSGTLGNTQWVCHSGPQVRPSVFTKLGTFYLHCTLMWFCHKAKYLLPSPGPIFTMLNRKLLEKQRYRPALLPMRYT